MGEDDFRRLYAAHFDAVLGFALRRTDRPEDAADVARSEEHTSELQSH